MKMIPALCGIAMLAAGSAQAELYRSIDSSGKVYYSDQPLAGAEDVEKLKIDKVPDDDGSLPYETQRAKQNFPVTLYSFKDCGSPCQRARDFLSNRGIPFAEKNMATQEEFDAFRIASGGSDVPAITVGKNWLKGFNAEQWGGELDVAGYPKIAPYRPRVASPAPVLPEQAVQPEPPAQPAPPEQAAPSEQTAQPEP